MIDIGLLVFAYGIGMIPSAYIYSKFFNNVDVREAGTGNVGAMNTLVNIGWLPGVLTLISDVAKGIIIVHLAMTYGSVETLAILALFILILAHNFNPALDMKGGKGFGNLAGGLILISPLTILGMFALTTVLLIVFKIPRVTAGFATLFFPLVLYSQTHDPSLLIGSVPITLIIVSKHMDTFKAFAGEWRTHHSHND